MIEEWLRLFARENFGSDRYLPVLHGETQTTKPLALVVKRHRSIWKRPFCKSEKIILDGLEKYVRSDDKEAYIKFVDSKIIRDEKNLNKGESAPASSHSRIGGNVAETAGITVQLDDDLGDVQLGKLSQEYISDPDLCDILANTVLDTNKMSRLENEHLLLITSVVYSEKIEIQGDRKRKVKVVGDVEAPPQIAQILNSRLEGQYEVTSVPPGVATRTVRGPILFKCCRVIYDVETKRLELEKGEFVGKLGSKGGLRAGEEEDEDEEEAWIALNKEETDMPDYWTAEDIEKLDIIKREVLMSEKSRERRKARVRKYLGWFEHALAKNEPKFRLDEPLTRDDCRFLRSIFVPSSPNDKVMDLSALINDDDGSKDELQGYGFVLKVFNDLPPEQWMELEMTLEGAED